MIYFFYRENQTKEQKEAELLADREQHKAAWAAKPKEQRQQRGAAIAANAKFKKQFESESEAFQRRKIQATTKKLKRRQR